MRLYNPFTAIPAMALLSAMTVHALVAPNAASLLKDKRILIIHGPNTSHADTRSAMTTKLNQIWAAAGVPTSQITTTVQPPGTLAALTQYDIIIFNYWFNNENTNFASFHTAFRQWVEAGPNDRGNKGWIGMHTSGATRPEWKWFRDSVSSMQYVVHTGAAQSGTVHRNDTAGVPLDPRIMEGLPASFTGSDEWYEYGKSPFTWPDVRVMYYLNESGLSSPISAHFSPHPMAWYREEPNNKTRFFFTPMIHAPAGVNSQQGNDFFPSLTLRALEWVAGYQPTSIKLNGEGLYHNSEKVKGVRHYRRGEDLRVESEGPYRLEIRDMRGRLLFRAAGRGSETHRPAALRQPGMYVVKVATRTEGKPAAYSQRVMVQ
jgi:hypothetical protein